MDSVSLFFRTDDRLPEIIIETPETVNTCLGFFAKGGLFMWPLLAVLDCLGDDNDFARPGFATEQGYAATDRERNRTFDPWRKS